MRHTSQSYIGHMISGLSLPACKRYFDLCDTTWYLVIPCGAVWYLVILCDTVCCVIPCDTVWYLMVLFDTILTLWMPYCIHLCQSLPQCFGCSYLTTQARNRNDMLRDVRSYCDMWWDHKLYVVMTLSLNRAWYPFKPYPFLLRVNRCLFVPSWYPAGPWHQN